MFMFDTNAVSVLVHQAKGFERIAERVEGLSYGKRVLSAISLSELQTMIEKAAQPRATPASFARISSPGVRQSVRWIRSSPRMRAAWARR